MLSTFNCGIGVIIIIKKNNCKKVIFAGKIDKPKISKLRLDVKGIYYIPRIIKAAKLGDAAIIKAIIQILKNENIKVISSIFYNPELALNRGNYAKVKPTQIDRNSIKKGISFFNKFMYIFS